MPVPMAIAALVLFAGVLLALGLRGRRAQADFFLAGRQAGAGAVAASLLATCLGASATLGVVGLAWAQGWHAFWWLGAGALGLALLSRYWAAPMRLDPATRTLPQWLGQAYGQPARRLAAAIILVMWIAVIAAQWVAAGHLLAGWIPAGRLPFAAGVLLTACLATLYTAAGGQRAVLRTDLVQLLLILAAIGLPVFFLARRPGLLAGTPSLAGLLPDSLTGLSETAALLLVVGGMYIAGPDLCSRVLLARDTRAARRGALAAALCLVPCALALTWTGLAARQLTPAPAQTEAAFSTVLLGGGIPAWAVLVVRVGLLAALLSSADTCLLTAASVLVLDLAGASPAPELAEEKTRQGRLAVVLFGLISTGVALWRATIIPNLLLAYAFYVGGLLPPLLLLRFPAVVRQVPRPAAWIAIVAGGTLPVLLLLGSRGARLGVARAGAAGALLGALVLAVGLLAGRRAIPQHRLPQEG